ncbi:hypothetical protein Y032_0077g1127 [Ancylostoma ceylanicum]|uniref:Uncharacterized protein n=1 Tax=Ancylostoma ceylanicum TaxID=53326 RepID=A0A016TTC4_9BILA|nr:hypothetical protein Y032_0077g1127 [Ancylostoma ceylanicum]
MTLIMEENGSQSADPPKRRHAAPGLVKKFSSLQVSHYPVLLFANTDTEEQPPSVVWKTSYASSEVVIPQIHSLLESSAM